MPDELIWKAFGQAGSVAVHRAIISLQSNAGATTSWPLYSEISIPLEWPEYLRNSHDFLIRIWGDKILTFSRNSLEVLLKSCAAASKIVSYSFTGQWFQSLFESTERLSSVSISNTRPGYESTSDPLRLTGERWFGDVVFDMFNRVLTSLP